MDVSVIRMTVLTVCLSLFPAWLSADAGLGLSVGPNHSIIDVRLAPDAFPQGSSFGLPQFRGYDHEGRQFFNPGQGFDSKTFEVDLNLALGSLAPSNSKTVLADEVALLVDAGGERVQGVPSDRVVLVKYWADWCIPCRFQARAVERVLKKHQDLPITILNVEADPTKLSGSASAGSSNSKTQVRRAELPKDFEPDSVTYRAVPKHLEDSVTGGESLDPKTILERLMTKIQAGEVPIEILVPLVETEARSVVRLLTSELLAELPEGLADKIRAGEPLTDSESGSIKTILDRVMAAEKG